jgi:hypothetical protein
MASAVLELPRGLCAPEEIGSLGAFFDTSPSPDDCLGVKEERLIRGLVSALDTYLLAAISARSGAEFSRERKKVWPKYVRSLRALLDTFNNLVPEHVMEDLSRQAMTGLDNDIQKKGESVFGTTLKNQALFTLWTIGKIRVLGREIIIGGQVSEDKRQRDRELAHEYHLDSLWSQFHLDCLVAAIKFDRPVCEEIRTEVCDGLRAAVNAYAIMKDAVALRAPSPSGIENPTPANLPWDDEDEGLLASSMRDINADTAEG